MIERVERLGEEVESQWKKEGYAKEAFSGIALRALQKSGIHRHFSVEEVLHWLGAQKEIPAQLSMERDTFGQPPITLFRRDRFVIDIYFWVTSASTIHSHTFQGAFTVLQGKKLQCHYDFRIRENIEENILIGDFSLEKAVFLKEGDIQDIEYGANRPTLTHQVFQITQPAVTLLVRSLNPEKTNYIYLKPHLGYREFRNFTPLERKQLDTLEMLHRINHPLEDTFLKSLISEIGDYKALLYLKEFFLDTGDWRRIQKVLETLPRFRRWAPSLVESFRTIDETRVMWTSVSGEKERLLMGLLHTFEEKESILQFVRRYFPEENAETLILEGLKKLMDRQAFPFELNETALEVLRLSLRGDSEEEICQELSDAYHLKSSGTLRQEVRDILNEMRSNGHLKPLVSPSSTFSEKRRSGRPEQTTVHR